MRSEHLYAIIDDAKQVHGDAMEDFIRRVVGDDEAPAAQELAQRVIHSVPQLLSEVSAAAEVRGIGLLVQPLLDHAAEYFLDPVDHAPELAYGYPGLLDDAYLALRLVNLVQEVCQPLSREDVAGQLEFLRRLLGPDLVYELDAEAGRAVMRMALHLSASSRAG